MVYYGWSNILISILLTAIISCGDLDSQQTQLPSEVCKQCECTEFISSLQDDYCHSIAACECSDVIICTGNNKTWLEANREVFYCSSSFDCDDAAYAAYEEVCFTSDSYSGSSGNIICNDGTESPTCSTCSQGCCSGHGGCS